MSKLFVLLVFSSLVTALLTVTKPPLKVVPEVELQRYLGKWYEIATIPQRFQKGCVCVTAEYSLNSNGAVKVVNSCRKGNQDGAFRQITGVARVFAGSNNAKLRVSFFRPFWGDYWIVGLDPKYQWAIVSNSKGTTCWILARTLQIDEKLYADLVEQCRVKGIGVSQLVKTPQDCAQK